MAALVCVLTVLLSSDYHAAAWQGWVDGPATAACQIRHLQGAHSVQPQLVINAVVIVCCPVCMRLHAHHPHTKTQHTDKTILWLQEALKNGKQPDDVLQSQI